MQTDVVRFDRQVIDLLAGVGEADAGDIRPRGESPVVISAALPQP